MDVYVADPDAPGTFAMYSGPGFGGLDDGRAASDGDNDEALVSKRTGSAGTPRDPVG